MAISNKFAEFIPAGYEIVETDELVPDGGRVDRYWLRARAERRAARLTEFLMAPSYRWCVVRDGRRWVVVAKQNVLRPIEEGRT